MPYQPDPDAVRTGLPDLDRVLTGLLAGDNIVWQVDAVDDYLPFVRPFVSSALAQGRRLIYFRFARHPELVPEGIGAEIHRLSPDAGFETFTTRIHQVMDSAGEGACYVFDSLSDLAADWYSDLMLGNFFMVTCPYVYELRAYAYFALLRESHSVDSVSAIRGTTQILIDVFRRGDRLYVHPLKVERRHSPTMYLPHRWEGASFLPLTESAVLADVLAGGMSRRADVVPRTLDLWDRALLWQRRAYAEMIRTEVRPEGEEAKLFSRYLRMMVTQDERLIGLASRWFEFGDLLAIRRRMIGTGLIGGKAVGMLLARAILSKVDPAWNERLETHDSFYIGSDVFYTFLVRNGLWRDRMEQRNPDSFLAGAEDAQDRVRLGSFPRFIMEQFVAMLEYFGQSPIIVRSSSLLEDSFGNAFSGKYESVFCPNQGSPQERLDGFLSAVRTVYASTMSREALLYRAHRGLIDRDEQMAILVQRVSGGLHGNLFFPQLAGVGLSDNPYVWSEQIDPEAGVLRLVFGLGTRAVNRSDDDYTRLVALNAPLRRPDNDRDRGAGGNSQRKMDLLDLSANQLSSREIDDTLRASPALPVDLYAARRSSLIRRGNDARPASDRWVLTFERLLADTQFAPEMRRMLATLREAYDYPVDTEFTANFLSDGRWKINLVQCRPLQVREGGKIVDPPARVLREDLLLETHGPIIGRSSLMRIRRVVFVDPAAYATVSFRDRPSVARLVGRVLNMPAPDRPPEILLLGPGRWGTTSPSLGVPASFAEIKNASVICEIIGTEMEVVPDVSLGTHFFNDMVEADMLYVAVHPGRGEDFLNRTFLMGSRNLLLDLLPDEEEWAGVVRVVDTSDFRDGRRLYLNANSFRQRAVCYLAPGEMGTDQD